MTPKLLLASGVFSFISFCCIAYISVGMIPYQDAPAELIAQQSKFIKTFTPILYLSIGVGSISFCIFVYLLIHKIWKFF